MDNLQEEYKEKVNIVIIYISEAHAKDEWPISHKNQTNQHTNLDERIIAAKQILNDYPSLRSKVFVDSFEEENYENEFFGWPERAYLIKNNKIKYLSYHKVDGIDDWYDQVLRSLEKY